MPKFKYNKNNSITNYIIKKMFERRPDDTLYALAKRTNLTEATLYKTFNSPFAWRQCEVLIRLCGDIGITLEEAILQTKKNDDKKFEEMKDKYYKLLSDYENKEKELKEFKKKLKNLL